jgi:predicted hotdog family 3-hydroxylacyl-ACP dehydratase
MDWHGIPLEEMLPHRERMRLVDRALSLDDERSVSEAMPRPDWPLCSGGEVSCLVTVELVAQTAALLEGWKRLRAGRGGASGYLVGIKTARFFRPTLPLGQALVTEVTRGYGLEDYAVFSGAVTSGGALVAQVQIQTVRQAQQDSPEGSPAGKEGHGRGPL